MQILALRAVTQRFFLFLFLHIIQSQMCNWTAIVRMLVKKNIYMYK
jgi:hypothetical protein